MESLWSKTRGPACLLFLIIFIAGMSAITANDGEMVTPDEEVVMPTTTTTTTTPMPPQSHNMTIGKGYEKDELDKTRLVTPDGAVYKYKVRVISDVHGGSEWFDSENEDRLPRMLQLMADKDDKYHGGFTHLIIAGNLLNFMAIPPDQVPPEPHVLMQKLLLGGDAQNVAEKAAETDNPGSSFVHSIFSRRLSIYWWKGRKKVNKGVAMIGEGLRSVSREGLQVIWLRGNAERGLTDKWLQDEIHKQQHLARDANIAVIDEKPVWEEWGLRVVAGQEMDLFAADDPRDRRPFSYYIDRIMSKHPQHRTSQRHISRVALREAFASLRMSVVIGTPQLAKPANCRKLLLEALRLANNGEPLTDRETFLQGHWRIKLDEAGMFDNPPNKTIDVTVDEVLEEYQTLIQDWIRIRGLLETENTIKATAYNEYDFVMGDQETADVVVFGHTLEDGQIMFSNGMFATQTGGWTSGAGKTDTYVDIHIGYTTTGFLRPIRVEVFHFNADKPEPICEPWRRGIERMSDLGFMAIITTSVVLLVFIVLLVILIGYAIRLLCPLRKLSAEDANFAKCRSGTDPLSTNRSRSSHKRVSIERQLQREKARLDKQKKRDSQGGSAEPSSRLNYETRRPTAVDDRQADVDDSLPLVVEMAQVGSHRASLPRLLRDDSRIDLSRRGSVCNHIHYQRDFDKIVEFIETNYPNLPKRKMNQMIKREFEKFHRDHEAIDSDIMALRMREQEAQENFNEEEERPRTDERKGGYTLVPEG